VWMLFLGSVFSTEESWTFGPPKEMKNRFFSATTLSGSTALPFVISTEAQRSGEISVWMLFLGSVFSTAYPDFVLRGTCQDKGAV
jgi:hypothetical protein